MTPEHRDAIRDAAKRRGNCPKCGSLEIEIVDGDKCGGMPGIKYRQCIACGSARAITKRPRKGKL